MPKSPTLSEAQTQVLTRKLAACLASDREPILIFFREELAFHLPNGGQVDDIGFIRCLQTAIDAEASSNFDQKGPIPKIRPSMSLIECADSYDRLRKEGVQRVSLSEERQAAVEQALRRRDPERAEMQKRLKDNILTWYDPEYRDWQHRTYQRQHDAWAARHPEEAAEMKRNSNPWAHHSSL